MQSSSYDTFTIKAIKECHFITDSRKLIVVKILHHLIWFIKMEELDSFIDFLVAFNLVTTSFRVLV